MSVILCNLWLHLSHQQHNTAQPAPPTDKGLALNSGGTMKLSLAGLKVHLAHCALSPSLGRKIGVTFTASGLPGIAASPAAH